MSERRRAAWTAGALLALGLVLVLAPLVWMVSTAFKPEPQILQTTAEWIPRPITTIHFRELLSKGQEAPVLRWLLNSAVVTTCITLLTLLVCSLAAYPLARMRFRGREALFYVILAAMVIPSQVTMIPNFLLVQRLGWFDTYAALIIPGLAGPFGVFLLRQFMATVPRDLEEAAAIDGCGPWRSWAQVVLPLTKPALATLAILTVLGAWNEFLWPLIVTNSNEMRTIPVGISIFQGRYATEYGLMMATALVASAPVVAAFLLGQRFILRGIVLTGLKG